MSFFTPENLEKAQVLVGLYPDKRSALIPLCHLAQSQHGHLSKEAMEEIAELLGIQPAEVMGTASFYDMLHTEEVGKYLVGVCTNVACLLGGGQELLDHASDVLGVPPGGTTEDGMFTLEEVECVAHCDKAPCAQVNYRYFGPLANDDFDNLVDDLKSGRLSDSVPHHGVLSRVFRDAPPMVSLEIIHEERRVMDEAKKARLAAQSQEAGGKQ